MHTQVTKERVMNLAPHYGTVLSFNDDLTTMQQAVKVSAHYCLNGQYTTSVYDNMEDLSALLVSIDIAA